MKKENIDRTIKLSFLIEILFVIVLVFNVYIFTLSASDFARIAIIIEIIAIIIAKNYLKQKLIKHIKR